jgi:hypothetical protein
VVAIDDSQNGSRGALSSGLNREYLGSSSCRSELDRIYTVQADVTPWPYPDSPEYYSADPKLIFSGIIINCSPIDVSYIQPYHHPHSL